ncbi:potassium channel family protein [Halalkalicoccus salilacus]|uniref:potassium channel family protein n=1 Tax=Halalkalicoccus sp. GCM10025704 TaxID=3252662 RepID=UPI003614F760
MNLLVVLMQLSGIAIGFFTLRLLVIPLFERTSINLENRLTAKDDHVVICEYRRDSDILLDELERLDIDYVLIDSDEEEATRLSNTGYQAISGDPEEVETLERAMIDDAALVITDAGDRNASIVLTALDLNEDLRLVSLTESARQHRALTEIGVDTVISPTPSSDADLLTRLRRRSRSPRAPPSARISRLGRSSFAMEVRFTTPRCVRRHSSNTRSSR